MSDLALQLVVAIVGFAELSIDHRTRGAFHGPQVADCS